MIYTILLVTFVFLSALAIARAHRDDPGLIAFQEALLVLVGAPWRKLCSMIGPPITPDPQQIAKMKGVELPPLGTALLGRPYPKEPQA